MGHLASPLVTVLVVLASLLSGGVLRAEEVVDHVLVVVGKEAITRYDAVTAWWIEGRPSVAMSDFVESLVDRKLLLAEGLRFGLQDEGPAAVSDERVRAVVASVTAHGGTVEASAVRRWLEEGAIIAAFRRIRVDPFVRVDRAAVRAAFEADQERYAGKRIFEVEEEIRESLLASARGERLTELLTELRPKAAIRRPESPLPFQLPQR